MALGAALLGGCAEGCGSESGRGLAQSRAEEQGDERVVLRARHPLGVPLHDREHQRSVSGRLPDGATVRVLRWGEERRWLLVRAEDGTRGWITARYLARGAEAGRRAPSRRAGGSRPDGPWSSPEACAATDPAARPDARARLASWNLRWFPDGSSHGPSERPTDVDWMVCAIASLGVEALAVQEVMLHDRGRVAMARLIERLNGLTGGRWEAHFDTCRRDGRQHVGWLVDARRAEILHVQTIDELNPAGAGGCSHHLRPGLAVYLRLDGGLDLWAVTVHLDSGVEPRDHGNRRQSVLALEAALSRLRGVRADEDALVIGDFNTMGCRRCRAAQGGRVDADEELAVLSSLSSSMQPPLRLLPLSPSCSEYYRRRGSALDHALITAATRELSSDARVRAHGACARHRCRLPRGVSPASLERLSDHCPIVVELTDQDLD